MKYETINDIYDGNARARERLKGLVSSLSSEQMTAERGDEKWTIAEIVEHIAIVDAAAIKICAKLLKKAQAEGLSSDGTATISSDLLQRRDEIATIKVEAPEVVRPTGEMSVPESLAKLDENFEILAEMRSTFETVDGTTLKFPHPAFGDISAQEWLALKGGHELRHIKQIERLLDANK